MWRFALSRRWWAGHVLVAVGCALFLGLARWQWDRAYSITGDWQNLGYALQWPLFAVFLVAGWSRFLWLEQHTGSRRDRSSPANQAANLPLRIPVPATTRGPARPTREDDPDDELAAYNAYLARLAEQGRRY